MRIIGLLSWYDEDPLWLKECVAGASQLCDFIQAVDGAYAHFPGAADKPRSPQQQHDIIVRTANSYGIGAASYCRGTPWPSEVEKRNFMIQQAKHHAREGDWFLRIDADEVLTSAGCNSRDKLAHTPHDVAEVLLWDVKWGGGTPLRALYRNVPGLRIEQAHYLVKAYGDTVLSGPNEAEAEDLWGVRLEHRTHERTPERQRLKAEYNKLIPEIEKVNDVPGATRTQE